MATLEKIRGKSGLLIGVVGLALFAFIIGDLMRSGSTSWQQSKEVVLNIDGEKVKIHEFQERLKLMEERYELSGNKLPDDQRMRLNNQLTQEYLQNFTIQKAANALGLKVSPQELMALIVGDKVNPSPVAQQFLSRFGINSTDKAAVADFIKQISDAQIKTMPAEQQGYLYSIQRNWEGVEESIINSRLQEKVSGLLSRSYVINDIDRAFESGVPNRQVAVVRTPSNSLVSDSTLTVSDQEIQKYYDAHKNFFVLKHPTTTLQFISTQVQPSTPDYADAEKEMEKARNEMLTQNDMESVARNYSQSFVSPAFLTNEELQQVNLAAPLTEFIKTAAVGEVNTPILENNHYSLVKLTGKKSSTESVNVSIILLDSINMHRADSLQLALNSGGSFANAARTFSADPSTKEAGGLITYPNRNTQMPDSAITELLAHQMQLDTIFKAPINQVLKIEQNGITLLVKASNPKPAVEKYKLAYIGIDVNFSDKTYNSKFDELNKLLISGENFDKMAEKARGMGLNVVDANEVNVFSENITAIPTSREIVSWGLKAKPGEVHDKLFRCGSDYLVIAAVKEQIPAGFTPLKIVKDQIKTELLSKKRGEAAVKQLSDKQLKTLDAYALAMNTKVDTLVGVSYQPRGNEAPELNAHAMSAKLNSISAPFASRNEVFVIEAISESDKTAGQSVEATIEQRRRAVGQQLAYRSFSKMLDNLEIKDNRATFY